MSMGEERIASGADETATVRIVRYPNRRLYDRSQGRYVTLPEIAAMIREGKMVSVRDSKTNDDLTSTILTQIILEHHPDRMALLPVPILHLMIRTNGVMLGLLREYFRQSLQYVEFWQRASAFNPMAASMEWLKSLVPASAMARDSQAPGAGSVQADANVLAERLAEMERRLNALDLSARKEEKGVTERRPRRRRRAARRPSHPDSGQPRDKA
jgi:polyhydroxyalkanoate synthesis repressor PhaR